MSKTKAMAIKFYEELSDEGRNYELAGTNPAYIRSTGLMDPEENPRAVQWAAEAALTRFGQLLGKEEPAITTELSIIEMIQALMRVAEEQGLNPYATVETAREYYKG